MPLEINGNTYVLATELAKQLGVSRQTMWRWRKNGSIPAGHKHRSGRVVFTEEEAEKIREFANRVEPLGNAVSKQLKLF